MSASTRPVYTRAPASAISLATEATVEPRPPFSSDQKAFPPLSPPSNAMADDGDPFATPIESRTPSRLDSNPSLGASISSHNYFHSRRVKKGDTPKPWTDHNDAREKWVTIIPLLGIITGLAISTLFVWDGLKTVVNHTYCPVLDDTFTNGLDPTIWTKEAEVGGFGNGQFEQTTTTDENIFVTNNMLHIKPTLQDPRLITTDNTTIDLRLDHTCTSPFWHNCLATTNLTNNTIIPPVKSGRLNAKSLPIKYGRIEVTARLPRGDWLWPAIWMLPVNSTYGPWPASGEIDILESRGNNHTYRQGGIDIMSSALHWGPNAANDAWWRTNNKRNALHTTFADKFHTFGLEWSERYLFTYINSRLLQVMYVDFTPDSMLWDRGKFPKTDQVNGTVLVDPWEGGVPSTPFDQEFYLILNVAVGGTNGWFEDGKGGKPWVDGGKGARRDFWEARSEWFPTWEGVGNGEMVVKRVRIWQQKGYRGC